MAENNFTGKDLVVKYNWSRGTQYLNGDYRSVSITRITNLAETTAGSETTKTHIETHHGFTIEYSGLFPKDAAGTVLMNALAPGTEGDLYIYPEGTAVGKPVRAYPVVCNGAKISMPYSDIVEISCTFLGGSPLPAVLIMLDDLSDSNYTNAFPILTTAGRKATFFAVEDRVGTTGSATLTQIQEMYAAGHDIGSHGKTHTNYKTLTQEQIETEISSMTAYLVANGMPRAAYHQAYPYGAYDSDVDAAMAATGMLTGRGTTPLGNLTFDEIHTSPYGLYKLPVGIYVRNTTVAAVKNEIYNARINREMVIILFHKISDGGTEYETSIADFTEIINYIAASTRVMTITQWFAEYNTLYG